MIQTRKTLVGNVIGTKMEKTVVVHIVRRVQHPYYKKVVKRRTKLKAHDERNQCAVGDTVRLAECRPLSKEKHWEVIEVLKQSQGVADR